MRLLAVFLSCFIYANVFVLLKIETPSFSLLKCKCKCFYSRICVLMSEFALRHFVAGLAPLKHFRRFRKFPSFPLFLFLICPSICFSLLFNFIPLTHSLSLFPCFPPYFLFSFLPFHATFFLPPSLTFKLFPSFIRSFLSSYTSTHRRSSFPCYPVPLSFLPTLSSSYFSLFSLYPSFLFLTFFF